VLVQIPCLVILIFFISVCLSLLQVVCLYLSASSSMNTSSFFTHSVFVPSRCASLPGVAMMMFACIFCLLFISILSSSLFSFLLAGSAFNTSIDGNGLYES
jgi:hypothetical protein